MFDNTILKPFSMCPHTGLEKRVKHIFGQNVSIFECKDSRKIRLIAYNDSGEAVSGLMVNPYSQVKTYTIDAVYTKPLERRRGLAKQLLAVARFTLGIVKHNEHLTNSGEAWRDSVEMLN